MIDIPPIKLDTPWAKIIDTFIYEKSVLILAKLLQKEPIMIQDCVASVDIVWRSLSVGYSAQTRMPSATNFWESEQIFATLDF